MICKIPAKNILFFLILEILVSYMTTKSQDNAEKSENLTKSKIVQSKVNEIKSSISSKSVIPWQVKSIQIAKDADINKTCFLDQKNGFAISFDQIFITFDGGSSWKPLNSPKNVGLKDIVFISKSVGFVIGYRLRSKEFLILKTENKGQSWKTVYSSDTVSLNKISFDASGAAWAIGRKNTAEPKQDTVNLVLISNDQGKTWMDVSEPINQLAKNGRGRVGDYLTDIIFPDDKETLILSLRGKIYAAGHQGKSWNRISILSGEPEQTGIGHLGKLDDGKLWIAGGALSQEGKWGMIAVMNDEANWDRYRLDGCFFSDIEFVSNNEIIACGAKIAKNNFGGADDLNKGIILYSQDSGKSWSIAHESSFSNEFISIDKLSENKLFITGKNGVGIFLERF